MGTEHAFGIPSCVGPSGNRKEVGCFLWLFYGQQIGFTWLPGVWPWMIGAEGQRDPRGEGGTMWALDWLACV